MRTCMDCSVPLPRPRLRLCPRCRRARHSARQKYYPKSIPPYEDPLPPGPPTSLDWLTKFSGWAKSGLSYAEYQKQSWLNKSAKKRKSGH